MTATKTLTVLSGLLLGLLAVGESESVVHVQAGADPRVITVTVVLPAELAQTLAPGKLPQEQGENLLQVFLRHDGKDGPPMLGKYENQGKALVFQPKFPLEPGELYGIKFLPPKGKVITAEYKVPLPAAVAPAVIEKIYPTVDVLPANHLKFYIYFSQPMRGGKDIFDQIQILDAKGNPVYDPWLRDELWSADGKMLIIYIHPGRIKWGVLLRQLLGPVLLPDREYTLKISGDMLDDRGQKLGKDWTKKFKTTAEDRTFVDLKDWKILPPAADSRKALTVQFPKILDHKLLGRFLTVVGPDGKAVPGTSSIGPLEKSWAFVPAQPWQAAEYTLSVDGQLEDVAGNTPLRPFDLDLKVPQPSPQKLQKSFHPLAP
jgi:hypothetical protein